MRYKCRHDARLLCPVGNEPPAVLAGAGFVALGVAAGVWLEGTK